MQIGIQSFEYALELKGTENPNAISHDAKAVEIARYYQSFVPTQDQTYLAEIVHLFEQQDENTLHAKLLEGNVVTKQYKHLLIVGIYTTVLQGKPVEEWTKKAREVGVSEEQLAEVGYICLLTAGIPSWFEISDALIQK